MCFEPSEYLRDETVGRLFLLAPFVRFIMLRPRRHTVVADGPEGTVLASFLSRLQMWPLGKATLTPLFEMQLDSLYVYV